jgi:acyl homoserine lactone synthase
MIQLITPNCYGAFMNERAEMHRLRYRIFKERLGWDVQVSGDMEIDEFDACRPVYLLQKDGDGRPQGCVRLLPTNGPTMLRDTFAVLLDGEAIFDGSVVGFERLRKNFALITQCVTTPQNNRVGLSGRRKV